jgi:uncharacterized protein (TIGR02996 family)
VDHASFLLELFPDPHGDFNRLVYADWLEDQGHPLAELLRLQVEIAGRPEGDPAVPFLHAREKAILSEQAGCFEHLRESLDEQAARKLRAEVLDLSGRNPLELACPICGARLEKAASSGRSTVLSWKLTPWFVFNELVLGQRLLRDGLACRGCGYVCVRCPACRRLPDQERFFRPFGHWRGVQCPECGAALRTQENLVTTAVLGPGRLARGLARLTRRRPRREASR